MLWCQTSKNIFWATKNINDAPLLTLALQKARIAMESVHMVANVTLHEIIKAYL